MAYEVWLVDPEGGSQFIEAFTDHKPAYVLKGALQAEIEEDEEIYYEVREVR